MRTGLIAKKLGMTQVFSPDGVVTPVTVLSVKDCVVLGKKTKEGKDGYNAIQLASNIVKPSKLTKPVRELFSKKSLEPRSYLKEFRVDSSCLLEEGVCLSVDHFSPGQLVDITGVSIGKGFAGSMKRHNFGGLRASHGVSVSHRSHGSTGNRQDPGKVFKNKKMAGHMGAKKVTKMNLLVYKIDVDLGLIFVKGSVPGARQGILYIRDAIKSSLNHSI